MTIEPGDNDIFQTINDQRDNNIKICFGFIVVDLSSIQEFQVKKNSSSAVDFFLEIS
jgi:hypothetical protein